jgi:hypothetical protein
MISKYTQGGSQHTLLSHFALVLFLSSLVACQFPASGIPTTKVPINTASEAIAGIRAQYPEVSGITPHLTPQPFVPDHVIVFERDGRWDIIFSTGSGDCPSGCLNNYYWYFSVWPDGTIEKEGEFSRVFVSASNSYQETGIPMWGFPR